MSDIETISDNGITVQVSNELSRALRVNHALQVLAGAMEQGDWPSESMCALVTLVMDVRQRVDRLEWESQKHQRTIAGMRGEEQG